MVDGTLPVRSSQEGEQRSQSAEAEAKMLMTTHCHRDLRKLDDAAPSVLQALALRLWSQAEHAYPVAEKLVREQTAAENGNADAQFNLGVMYANGEGMPQQTVTRGLRECGTRWPRS